MAEIEGVIKFTYRLQPPTEGTTISVPTDLMDTRALLKQRGWIGQDTDGVGYGNTSSLIENTKQIVISSSQTSWLNPYDSINWSMIDEWDMAAFSVQARGHLPPSSECLTHIAIYGAMLQYGAVRGSVLHIHHRKMWLAALGILPSTHPDASYGTPEMVTSVHEICGKILAEKSSGVIIMSGHETGILTFGTTPGQALQVLEHTFGSLGIDCAGGPSL